MKHRNYDNIVIKVLFYVNTLCCVVQAGLPGTNLLDVGEDEEHSCADSKPVRPLLKNKWDHPR